MSRQVIYFENLLGREVIDIDGKRAGRIEEVIARRHGDVYHVEEFLLGFVGLSDRLSIPAFALHILRLFGVSNRLVHVRIPFSRMDISDPTRPRLNCSVDELTTGSQ